MPRNPARSASRVSGSVRSSFHAVPYINDGTGAVSVHSRELFGIAESEGAARAEQRHKRGHRYAPEVRNRSAMPRTSHGNPSFGGPAGGTEKKCLPRTQSCLEVRLGGYWSLATRAIPRIGRLQTGRTAHQADRFSVARPRAAQ